MDGTAFADGIALLGVPAVFLVPLIVQGLKRLGMPSRWATLAAIVAGAGVAALAEVVEVWPETIPVVRVALAGIVLGFGASGVYSQARRLDRAWFRPAGAPERASGIYNGNDE